MSVDLAPTAGEIAAVVGGRLASGDPNHVVTGYSIDSRTLSAGDLFFAIRGERFDGGLFVEAAFGKGACGAVVTAEAGAARQAPEPRPLLIEVADTTKALQALAGHIRRVSSSQVVAITGSAGKTTTKEAAAEFLSGRYRVFRNRGNLNNHIGLPLSLLELRHRPDIAVVELGMNHAGEIRALVSIAEPHVRVWINVGDAHLGFFASVDAIADAKAEILEGATRSSVLIAGADDPRIMARTSGFAGRVITFGIDRDADIRATEMRDLGIEGTLANVRTAAGEAVMHSPLLGRGNLANVLAATAVALHFDVPLRDIVGKAAALAPAPHRGAVIRLPGGVTLIDDSYNSNPTALSQALAVLAGARSGRRVAVIGEMLELGDRAIELHRASGRTAAEAGLDALIAVGGEPARALAAAAVAAGMADASVRHVATSDEAASAALGIVRRGDLVLVKGSRGIRTDVVVDLLAAELG